LVVEKDLQNIGLKSDILLFYKVIFQKLKFLKNSTGKPQIPSEIKGLF